MTGSIAVLASGTLLVALIAQAPAPQPQPQPANLIEEVHRLYYTPVQNNILRAAEQFPEDKYKWQPTPEVRSWARLIGHLIDDNNMMCWAITKSGPTPSFVDMPGNADSGANKMSKAELVAGLKASIERCNQTFASLTTATMTEPSGMRPGTTKIGMLIYNTSHTNEHYGNLVTYMRLQGMVPPSSAGRGGRGN
jgi:uncharacterized damage-inducible protein DinB